MSEALAKTIQKSTVINFCHNFHITEYFYGDLVQKFDSGCGCMHSTLTSYKFVEPICSITASQKMEEKLQHLITLIN